ncbi:PREDICTED: uncharacterized protein LOC109483031 [Branchiostoma belcheri]|uniref:Uncharacterized protein LOC109483031 n=1 Tax=Branchiostoma belcheri TaxID=7741 RepID=A0A6P4ZK00_BRABE|nr:PREDICTED: uncharacterized protein LOC109483031 [Branchiostoma belcheri]
MLQLPSIEMLTADRAIAMQLQESYEGMPDNRIAIRTTGDGDCLFHAVGKLLRGGREEHTMLLRLGAVVFAVNHQKHIVDELYGELKRADEVSVGRFFSMISDVGQDKTDLYERLTDVVQEQARKTMNRGEYSGILPIKFLAGFVRSHILLYCPNPTDSIGYAEYNNVLRTPCSCILDSIPDTLQLEVMLVGAPRRNHFVGLVPTSDDRDVTETDGATNDRATNGSDYSDEATGSGPTAKKEDAKATSQPPSQHGERQQSAGKQNHASRSQG